MVCWYFIGVSVCLRLQFKKKHFYVCRNVLLVNINQPHYHNSGSYC